MLVIALVCLLSLVGAVSADAGCYDGFGCANVSRFRMSDLMSGPNCEMLYSMRNAIFAEHGYCFRTARGRLTFGNQGCITSDLDALGLNPTERYNVGAIQKAERAKGCVE